MANSKKAILLIMDGVGDLPTPKTPLQVAKKPNLDSLAKKGSLGQLYPVKPFVTPGSDTAHLNILGYDPYSIYQGRGPLEALGLGMTLLPGDVAFRANFATIKDGKIVDRRAGRVDTQTSSKLAPLLNMKIDDVEVIFKSASEHRGALILRGPALSPAITATDAHESEILPQCTPLNKDGAKTARIVNEFTKISMERLASSPLNSSRSLPANVLLLRGAATFTKVPTFKEKYGIDAACVAGGALYKGVARYIGMNVLDVPLATGDKNTDLSAKAKATLDALKTHDFVFLHFKATDNAGHDGDFALKKKMIERVDKELIPSLVKSGAYLVVTGDHSTPVSRKAHSGHPVPFLVYGKDERPDKTKKFDEFESAQGSLGKIDGQNVIPLSLNLLEKGKKYGS